jgi:AraC family transcriptional regulator of adaptative response/methylated-DNA-[protein]-cysteine methyltransferase
MAEEIGQISNVDWNAVVMKDRHSDGKFVYAAVTTGIYCRPSCPARNPHRRNTLIFRTTEEAERQGYVSCQRCHPNSLTPAERSVKVALDYIETNLDQTITLNTLSQISGISPHHLQETFKRILGLSPKVFCDARRVDRFKQRLRAGMSICNACYEVGYGSSRALYEKTRKGLGMTPAVYQRGGKRIHIFYSIGQSAMDSTLLARTKEGVCAIRLGENEAALVRELHREFPGAMFLQQESPILKTAIKSCEKQDPLLLKLSVTIRRRVFLARMWNYLQ